ncbi:MAG: hypothetical protein R3B95_08050 [Nitrospirales bacterium]|nr:hypothetical protein [Nitrospirales bacterium]
MPTTKERDDEPAQKRQGQEVKPDTIGWHASMMAGRNAARLNWQGMRICDDRKKAGAGR